MRASTVSRFLSRVCLLGVVLFGVKACNVMAPGNYNEFSGIIVMLPLGGAMLCGLFAALFYAGARACQKGERSAGKQE